MVEVGYRNPEADWKTEKHHARIEVPPSKRELVRQASTGDVLFRSIINIFFSFVYWLFCCIYFLSYAAPMSEAYKKGFSLFLKSKIFWAFQRDVFLSVVGYRALIMVINKGLFGN